VNGGRLAGSLAILLAAVLIAGGVLAVPKLFLAACFGIIATAAAISRPSIAVIVVYIGVCLNSAFPDAASAAGLPITPSKVATVFGLGTYLTHAALTRRKMFRVQPITIGLLLVPGAAIASLPWAYYPSWGYPIISGQIMLVVLVHYIASCVDAEDWRPGLRILAVVQLALFGWALAQREATTAVAFNFQAWGERTSGGLGDPNDWATLVIVTTPVLIAGLSRDKTRIGQLLLLGLVTLYPIVIFQSFSRAGLLAMGLTLIPLAWVLRDYRRYLFPVAVVAGIVALQTLNFDSLMLRYATLMNPTLESSMGHGSLDQRMALLNVGLDIIWDNPLTGIGAGNFRYHAAQVTAGGEWKVAHNTYITVLAEYGLPGLIAVVVLVTQLGRTFYQTIVHNTHEYSKTLSVGFLVAFMGFATMMVTLNLETFAPFFVVLGLYMACVRVAGTPEMENPPEPPGAPAKKPARVRMPRESIAPMEPA